MATTLQSPPVSPKTSALRRWFPLLAIAMGAVLVTGVRLWPAEEMPPLHRNLGTFAAGGLTALLLLIWLLLFAPFRRSSRLLILAVVVVVAAGGFVACVRKVRFTGDLKPIFTFRWDRTAQEALKQHRLLMAKQGPAPAARGADLSGGSPNDYPEYRGRLRDGVVKGPALAPDWSASRPRKLWRQPVGGGHSGFAVAGGSAVTLEQRDEEEVIVCYDVATGRERWLYAYPALFEEQLGGEGPRSTPTIRNGEVYALGATGKLVCLDATTGEEKWTADVLKDNANVKWGLAGSPLVVGKVVIVNPGAQKADSAGTLVAYDRATGKRVWSAGQGTAGYSSPMLVTLGGKPQVLLLDGQGLSGYDPDARGKELWRHSWPVQEDINVAQPVLLGRDRVFITSGYGVGCAALEVKKDGGEWSVKPLWRSMKMRCRFSSPILHDGYLYGLDEGVLVCLDAETGKRQWRGERYGHGQVLLTHGLLLITSEDGELALVEASPKRYHELTRMQAVDGRTWNVPALAGGLVFVRNHEEMACYDLRARPE
jgi:outer membrane protein assembly factor BamB